MILTRIVVPLVSAFAVFVAMALVSLRRPPRGAAPVRPTGAPTFRRYLMTVVGGGYAVFLVIVAVFHVLIAGQRGALRSAAAGGAFLAFAVATPIFVCAEVVAARRRRPGG